MRENRLGRLLSSGDIPARAASSGSRRMRGVSPLPDELDVRLSLSLNGTWFHFAACLTAALLFVQEHQQRRCVDAVTVAAFGADNLPRLPNERLYLEP